MLAKCLCNCITNSYSINYALPEMGDISTRFNCCNRTIDDGPCTTYPVSYEALVGGFSGV